MARTDLSQPTDSQRTEQSAVTPMMSQFLEIKAINPGYLLFYRMGDFYEMFFDDAVAAAEALDIALTKRGFHLGEPIAMCGVPVHAAEGYLLSLIRKGFRVAIAEQMDDPAEAKKKIGYLPESAPLYNDMTVVGFLKFCAAIRGLKGTAKVYGERTSLFTYLLRRPLATLRIWLAL